MQRNRFLYHDKLVNRLEFRGAVQLETALHVGTGKATSTADAGIIRDFQARPFIPGSSLKGALRSAVERRVDWLGLDSCYLAKQDCFDIGEKWRDKKLEDRKADIEEQLCAACRVFGSTVIAGKVQIDDLPLLEPFEPLAQSLTEVRDGVGIDRDSGTAVDGAKFNYEVVPSMTFFRFYLSAENLEAQDRALLALGLLEMVNGAIAIGGKSTRGLGRCELLLESVYFFDFFKDGAFSSEVLLEYLKPPNDRASTHPDPRKFLEDEIRDYLRGASDAQKID